MPLSSIAILPFYQFILPFYHLNFGRNSNGRDVCGLRGFVGFYPRVETPGSLSLDVLHFDNEGPSASISSYALS